MTPWLDHVAQATERLDRASVAWARCCCACVLAAVLSSGPVLSDDAIESPASIYEDHMVALYAAMSCGINVAEELVAVHSWGKSELPTSEREAIDSAVHDDNLEFQQDLTTAWMHGHYNALEDLSCISLKERLSSRDWPSSEHDDPEFRQMVMQACIGFIPTYCPTSRVEVLHRMNDVTLDELGRQIDPSGITFSEGRLLNMWSLGCGLRSYDASLDKSGHRCQAMMNEMLSFGSYGAASDYVLPDPPAVAVADGDDDYRAYHAYFEVLIATRACGIENGARTAEVMNWTVVTFDEHKHMVAFLTDDTLDAIADRLKRSLGNLDAPLDCDGIMETYLATTWPSELP